VSSPALQRPDKAEYYIVKDVWVDDGASGKDVVIEVQGVRGDGSYWVTGIQVRIPKTRFDSMPTQAILSLIKSEVVKNEAALDDSYLKMLENETLSQSLKKDSKAAGLIGVRVDYK
jgi:hypothetical protein